MLRRELIRGGGQYYIDILIELRSNYINMIYNIGGGTPLLLLDYLLIHYISKMCFVVFLVKVVRFLVNIAWCFVVKVATG